MKTDEALARLAELVAGAGIDPGELTSLDVSKAVRVMERFAADKFVDVDPTPDYGDSFLAQFGTYNWDGTELFNVDLTRQFAFTDDQGEFLNFDQLQCTFYFTSTDSLRALGSGNVWSSEVGLDNFWERALELPGFRVTEVPTSLELRYNEV
jgi:hypothetical protein